jgi:hypothetical protein
MPATAAAPRPALLKKFLLEKLLESFIMEF